MVPLINMIQSLFDILLCYCLWFMPPRKHISIASISTWKFSSNNSSHRTICKKRSHKRRSLTTIELESGCRLGIDSHADTTCAGRHFKITERIEGTSYNVSPFSGPSFNNVSMVNGLMATDREDGQDGYILEINNALDFTNAMEHSLLCPMQARLNGVKINDVPTSLDLNSTQSIIFPNGSDIPIHYHGPIPYINVRYPTPDDRIDFLGYLLQPIVPGNHMIHHSRLQMSKHFPVIPTLMILLVFMMLSPTLPPYQDLGGKVVTSL